MDVDEVGLVHSMCPQKQRQNVSHNIQNLNLHTTASLSFLVIAEIVST